ncbi:ATP-binding protein [Pseudoalteromonas sp. GB56]
MTLPDGRDGKVIYTHFIPQVDTEDRATFFENQTTVQSPMTLAYAASAEELNFILWLIDFVFVTTTIAVVIFIRLFVSKSVDTSLRPLNKLNNDISQLSIAQKGAKVTLDEPISELVPMVESLNSFIDENRQLFLREKRLTSDIAHELKTPIAELINLSQVVIRFPGNKELEEDFTPEVLRISQRLKSIVENLLALNRYANHQLACEDVLDLNQVVERLCEGYEQSRIRLRLAPELPILVSNLSALESIIVNLLRNALQHSPDNSAIEIGTSTTPHGQPKLYVKNQLLHPLSEDELSHVFEPLWQKDAARTSDENFGLGLSISQALAAAIQSTLYVESDSTHIVFVLECFSNKR